MRITTSHTPCSTTDVTEEKNILVSPSAVSVFCVEGSELEIEIFVAFHTRAQPHFRKLHEVLGTTEICAGNCQSTI